MEDSEATYFVNRNCYCLFSFETVNVFENDTVSINVIYAINAPIKQQLKRLLFHISAETFTTTHTTGIQMAHILRTTRFKRREIYLTIIL